LVEGKSTVKDEPIGKQIVALMNKREKLKGTKIFNDLQNLATSQYFVMRNYQELITQIMPYEQDISIWDVTKRDKLNAFLRELSRLIHNYLSSTFSLISHSSNFCEQLKNKSLRREYDEMVAKLKFYDFYHFVKDLRRFNQHIGLPLISAHLDIHPKDSNDFQSRILFDKKILLEWDGWTSGSKNYLKMHKEVEVKAVFSEYQELIKEFYDWFYKKISNVYVNELKEFFDNEFEIGRLWQLQEAKNQADIKK
jgi:hypothetical protein